MGQPNKIHTKTTTEKYNKMQAHNTTEPAETHHAKQETESTVTVQSLYDEEVLRLENGKFALPCNVCCAQIEAETDESQKLSCGHHYIEKAGCEHKAKFSSKMEEMVFRMKAVMQGNEDCDNKKVVDGYYEQNDHFMSKYPMYGRYKTGLQNMAMFKKSKKKTSAKFKWSKVRKQIKSLTWIYKKVSTQNYNNF